MLRRRRLTVPLTLLAMMMIIIIIIKVFEGSMWLNVTNISTANDNAEIVPNEYLYGHHDEKVC